MNYRGAITEDMSRLLELFSSSCTERESFDWLKNAVTNRAKWHEAHGVFNDIRRKTLKSERTGNGSLAVQYLFEEICAKILYNLSGASAPFDSDSPCWLVPNAIAFARRVGIAEAAVLACIASQSGEL